MSELSELKNLMTSQHTELSKQIGNIQDTVKAIDVSIQGDEDRGVAGMKHHIRELKDSSINHHERISLLEQELPKAKQNNKVMFGMGAGAGAAAAATSIKVGGWAAFKSGMGVFVKWIIGAG